MERRKPEENGEAAEGEQEVAPAEGATSRALPSGVVRPAGAAEEAANDAAADVTPAADVPVVESDADDEPLDSRKQFPSAPRRQWEG